MKQEEAQVLALGSMKENKSNENSNLLITDFWWCNSQYWWDVKRTENSVIERDRYVRSRQSCHEILFEDMTFELKCES